MQKISLLLVGLCCSLALAQGHDHDATVNHSFDDPERWAEVFDAPDRQDWQKPQIVLSVLGIDEGIVVADLGAGTGYFTRLLGGYVGVSGKVYAVDVEPKMLEYIETRPRMPGNIVTVLATPDDPKLPPAALDLVLCVNTWHHIDGRMRYLERLRGALRQDGRVAIIDWHEGELPMGPPPGSKLSRESLIAEFTEAGWEVVAESVALPYQYFVIFRPGAPAASVSANDSLPNT